jgi:hypothetical protein
VSAPKAPGRGWTAGALAAALPQARPLLLERYGPDSCLESARFVAEAGALAGVPVREVPCRAMILNAPLWKWTLANGRLPRDRAETERLHAAIGAHSIGIGYGQRLTGPDGKRVADYAAPGRYDGHLVALLAGAWLVDLALDQASRPAQGMPLRPLARRVGPAFAAGLDVVLVVDGTAVRYEPSGDRRYLEAGGWARPAKVAELRALAAAFLRGARR